MVTTIATKTIWRATWKTQESN